MKDNADKLIDTENLVVKKSKEKIFFGEYSGFQRYDNPSYSFATKMEEHQRNAFWNPSEVSMIADSQKFFEMPKHIQTIMIHIWLFQTLMDSGQNKGLEEVLAEICTNTEFEAMFKTWGYFELIHSLSYSHILRGIFSDSTAVFNSIADIPEITSRINKEIDLYSEVKLLTEDSEESRKKILELLVSVLALEGVKFYVSFLVTYVVNNAYNNKIAGTNRIIKLINYDEDTHTSMMNGLLRILRSEKSEGFSELMASEWYSKMVKRVLKGVYEEELDWGKHLLSIGNIPGLTTKVLEGFLQYYTDFRAVQLKEPKIFNAEKTDIVRFFENYKDMNKDNSAQQESDLAVYSIGILENDIPEGKIQLDFFNN